MKNTFSQSMSAESEMLKKKKPSKTYLQQINQNKQTSIPDKPSKSHLTASTYKGRATRKTVASFRSALV